VCATCALFSSCAVKKAKHGYRLLYNHNEADAASRRRYERSAEFKDKYRYRAGIEATNSRYVQMTGARRMRYRGLKRIDNAARLKALGINMFRAAKYIASQVENPCYT
jgi:IS5 family transposase